MIAAPISRSRLVTAAIALISTIESGHGVSRDPGCRGGVITWVVRGPGAPADSPSTMCSLSITPSMPASSASAAIRTSPHIPRRGHRPVLAEDEDEPGGRPRRPASSRSAKDSDGQRLSPLVKFVRSAPARRRARSARRAPRAPPDTRKLEPRQVGSEALVRAAAPERQMSVGLRATSKTCGSGNSASSRFPDTYQSIDLVPARIVAPPSEASAAAVRRMKCVGQVHRSTSSAAGAQQRGVGPQPVPLLRVLAEREHPLGDRDPRGLVPGDHQDREEVVQSGSLSRSPSTSAPAGWTAGRPGSLIRFRATRPPARVPTAACRTGCGTGSCGRRRCRPGPRPRR